MFKLAWDQIGERVYETGVDHGVIYPFDKTTKKYNNPVAWNGLTAVTESPSGAEPSPLYADNIKYLNLISAEEFGATVESYTYPDKFADLDGTAEIAKGVRVGQQARGTFGMSYRTTVGNDTENEEYGYKIHLIYGATATPSEKGYNTRNDSPDAITFSWTLNTVPVDVPGLKPTASLTIDSTKVDKAKLTQLENILYGTTAAEAVYAVFTGDTFETGVDYYTKSGVTYAKTTDTTPDSSKTYYTLVSEATEDTEGYLPLPAEVAAIFAEG